MVALRNLSGPVLDVQLFFVAVTVGVHKRQRYHRSTKAAECFGSDNAFAVHESIQNAYQCRALSGKVLKVEHLESAQTGSAQAVFNISLVAFDGKPAGGLMECVNLVILQSIFIEPVTEYLQSYG